MTYQKPPTPKHDDDDTVEEASSLLFGQGGGDGVPARKKKHGVPTMRTMVVTACVLLGTFAMIYGGRGSSTTSATGLRSEFGFLFYGQ